MVEVVTHTYKEIWEMLRAQILRRDDPVPLLCLLDLISPRPPLTMKQAEEIEDEMRRLEADPNVTKNELRLFLQFPMPCGHAAANLLTCPTPPFGCVICGEPTE